MNTTSRATPTVTLISQSGARKVFGDENPIGQTLLVTSPATPAEIIGVVGDVRSGKIGATQRDGILSALGAGEFPLHEYHRAQPDEDRGSDSSGPEGVNSDRSDHGAGSAAIDDEIVKRALGEARLTMFLLGVFAGVALLLATVGIYGAVAYTVEQRTGEIGVRMALGAQTLDVLRLVVSQGMKPVFFGLIIGLAAALALGRLIASQLYQVSAHNPMLLGTTVAVLGAAALLACIFPARRASRVNPVVALRIGIRFQAVLPGLARH